MVIGLLTDFGMTDAYAGVMKGVILNIAPTAQIVDITHAVQPQNVRQAALTLENVYRYFPLGTIFLVVVDPGVGSARRAVAVQAGGWAFVAPDNGVLSYALSGMAGYRAVTLANPAYRLAETSSTFHGRDIFAPAAGHLAAGAGLDRLGSPVDDLVILKRPRLQVSDHQIEGEVTHIDHFGNIVTSIGQFRWESPDTLELSAAGADAGRSMAADRVQVALGETRLMGIKRTYSDTAPGELLCLVGSSGCLEMAVNGGDAARRLGVKIGGAVVLRMG